MKKRYFAEVAGLLCGNVELLHKDDKTVVAARYGVVTLV